MVRNAGLDNPDVQEVERIHGVDKAKCDDEEQQRGLGPGDNDDDFICFQSIVTFETFDQSDEET